MTRLLIFVLLCVLTITLIRSFRSTERKTGDADRHTKRSRRPAASPDEIVDVNYEECGLSGDDKGVGS